MTETAAEHEDRCRRLREVRAMQFDEFDHIRLLELAREERDGRRPGPAPTGRRSVAQRSSNGTGKPRRRYYHHGVEVPEENAQPAVLRQFEDYARRVGLSAAELQRLKDGYLK
jgi:hypothetical protein